MNATNPPSSVPTQSSFRLNRRVVAFAALVMAAMAIALLLALSLSEPLVAVIAS